MRQSGERLLHLLSQLDALGQAFRSGLAIMNKIHRIAFRFLLAFCSWPFPPRVFLPPLAHAVDGIIRRDSIDPRSEVRSRCELSQLLVRPQKGLLNHLFGVVPIPGHAVGQAKNILAVPFDENAKRIAIASERALDGEGVAVCDGIGALDALRHPIH